MVEAIAFQTRARTIDHLGREQIADCPTAISELWKNAYDAYARRAALHIFDGEVPVAVIADDGHGMNRMEFVKRWLVLGTESKASDSEATEEDRDGLPLRPKQGQKGIGRLSCAALGSLLLVVSKRRTEPFVASLIDWRLFENPFLMLEDIKIPVIEFDDKDELLTLISGLFDSLISNIWGDGRDSNRDERISAAWSAFDEFEKSQDITSTRESIERVVNKTAFDERHLSRWPVWTGISSKGTMLMIGDISFDLIAQLPPQAEGDAETQARDTLFETLSNFSDPFTKQNGMAHDLFSYSVTAWNGNQSRPVISEEREFDLSDFYELEHILEGNVDEKGIFRGKIKSFGNWLEGNIEILPSDKIPTRSDSRIGHFHIRMGTYERDLKKSTLSKELYLKFSQMSEKYAGLMMFRDMLRVMPYGREDYDFFGIEKRRAAHAGREFWQNQRLFGRIAFSRKDNPNLKDKAGREGLIDNRAAKGVRDLVKNILMISARRYFGTDSDIRKSTLPEIVDRNKAEKADEERKKLRAKKRKDFRKNLKKLNPQLEEFVEELDSFFKKVESTTIDDERILFEFQEDLSEYVSKISIFSLGEAPQQLGTIEEQYNDYRKNYQQAQTIITELRASLIESMEKIKPKEPSEIALSELNRNAAHLHKRIRQWKNEIFALLESEKQRIRDLADEKNKYYHSRMLPLIDDVEHQRVELKQVLVEMAREKESQDLENENLFKPYISALESLKQSIDLETLAAFGMEKVDELRQELDRLNSLAQLGITVEIIGHELESLDMTVSRGLREMPESVKSTEPYQSVKYAYEDLTNRLRFLSPLKLSGDRVRRWINGREIYEYIEKFFGDNLNKNNIRLETTPDFENFRVYEQPARLFPVFINLINNSRYWINRSVKSDKRILLDVILNKSIKNKEINIDEDNFIPASPDGKIVVADDGPGVEEQDLKHLFTLFFTRKVRGGRGVGLYLCRTNLAAGGHTIYYATKKEEQKLPGANFVIDFKGAEYA